MDYKETIDWLFTQLPIYQRVGQAAYKADLSNTIQLLNILGNPQRKFKAIHVAGTNGKGSVAHLLASILQEAGYKTGLYTSPHLKDFRERIRINGEMINENQVVDFVSANQHAFEDIKPSFFEMTVGMAFDYFEKEKVDYAVLETGMGGRLDSTNVSNPVVSVITNIGFDHMQFLGDTIEKISAEKAGIIKEKVPVVIGKTQAGAKEVFEERCKEKESPIYFADQHFEFREIQTRDQSYLTYDVWKDHQLFIEKLDSPLLGKYQSGNIATALQTLEVLKSLNELTLSTEDIRQGIELVVQHTGLQGRWQILHKNPLTICDTGHNPEGLQAVVEQIADTQFEKLHFVFGMVNDKNPESLLYLLPKHATYYFCKPDIPRGMDVEELKEHAFKAGLRGEHYSSVNQALHSATNNAKANDLVFVGGSTFVVAEVI